jgi:flavin-dependent dehydrogenase
MSDEVKANQVSEFYNFVIVGAGTGGLTAGIIAARNGYNAIILEKGSIPSPRPRGETVVNFPLMDEILGEGFLPSIATHETAERTFISPKCVKQVTYSTSRISYIFKWREFIDQFVKVAEDLGVVIRVNSEATSPIIKDDFCVGIEYKNKEGEVKQVFGNAVLACDGYESAIGRFYHIDYEKINNPIVKCLVSNANINFEEHQALELFVIAHEDLEYAPNFPYCAAFMFPRGGKEAEVGLINLMATGPKIKSIKAPSNEEFLAVWKRLKEDYPIFSDYFKGSSIEHEEITAISSARLVKDYIQPGVVLIGDSAGFVEPTGHSGLYSSMAMAKEWVDLLSNELKSISSQEQIHRELWNKKKLKEYKKIFENGEVYRHIKKLYKLVHIFYWYVFKRRGTAERINEKFDFIIKLLKKGKP